MAQFNYKIKFNDYTGYEDQEVLGLKPYLESKYPEGNFIIVYNDLVSRRFEDLTESQDLNIESDLVYHENEYFNNL